MELSQQDKEAFLNRINAIATIRQAEQGAQEKESSTKSEWTDEEIKMAISLGW